MHRRCTRNATAIVMRHFYQRASKVWHGHAATHLVNFVTAKLSAGRKSDILCLGVMCLCLLALLIFFILRRFKSSMDLNNLKSAQQSPKCLKSAKIGIFPKPLIRTSWETLKNKLGGQCQSGYNFGTTSHAWFLSNLVHHRTTKACTQKSA